MQKVVVGNKSKGYKKKIWIISLLVVLIIGITGMVLLEVRWKPMLSQKMKEGVHNRSFLLYKLDFKDISFNLFTRSATLHQVSLTPDTSIYNQLKAIRLAPARIYQVKLEKLHLNNIAFITAYFKREIDIEAIILEQAFINVIHYQIAPLPDVIKLEDEPTIYQMISNRIKSIDVKTIKIADGDFNYTDGETSKSLLSVKHLNANLNDFLIDSLSQYDPKRPYYFNNIAVEGSENKSISKDKLDTVKSILLSMFSKKYVTPRANEERK